MNKYLHIIFICLALGMTAQEAAAQANDVPEPAEKAVKSTTTITDSIQKKFDEFSNSDLVKKGGKGIQDAKKGMAAAQEWAAHKMEQAQELMAKAAEAKELLSRTAALSKQITTDTSNIAKFPTETVAKTKELQENFSAKIKRLSQNIDTLQNAAKTNSDLIDLIPSVADQSAEIANLQAESMESVNLLLKERADQLNTMTAQLLRDQEELEKLQEDYQKLMGKEVKKKDNKENREKLKQKLFLKPGEVPSLERVEEILQNRIDDHKKNLASSLPDVLKLRASVDASLESAETTSDVGGTMPGKSEKTGTQTDVITQQTERLKGYVDIMVMSLKMDIAMRIALSKKYNLSAKEGDDDGKILNFCDYSNRKNMLDMLGEGIQNVNEAAGSVAQTASSLQETAGSVTDTVNDAKNAAGDAISAGSGIAGSVSDTAGAVSDGVSDISSTAGSVM